MMGIEQHLEKESKLKSDPRQSEPKNKGTRADIDDEDDEESYYRYTRFFYTPTIFIMFWSVFFE